MTTRDTPRPNLPYLIAGTPAQPAWRPILAVLSVTGAWFIFGGFVIGILSAVVDIAAGRGTLDDLIDGRPWMSPVMFASNNIAQASLILWACAASALIMRTHPVWLWSLSQRFNLRAVVTPLAVSLFGYGIYHVWRQLTLNHPFANDPEFALYALVAIATVPLQCAGEELAFRGLLPRAIATVLKGDLLARLVAVVLSSAAFVLIHGASNVYLNSYYFLFGIAMAIVATKTGGLAAPIAIHTSNNLLANIHAFYWGGQDQLFERGEGMANVSIMIPIMATLTLVCIAVILVDRRRREANQTLCELKSRAR